MRKLSFFLAMLSLLSLSTHAEYQLTAVGGKIVVGGKTLLGSTGASSFVPTFVQHIHTVTGGSEVGQDHILNFDPVPGGNLAVVCLNYSFATGRTLTISDSTGGSNTWTAGPTTNDGNGGTATSIFYSMNTTAGTHWIKTHWDASITNVQMLFSNFYNVATSSAADGSAANSNLTATGNVVTNGSFTTTQNGDLIYTCGIDSNGGFPFAATSATGFTAGAGLSLLSAQRNASANMLTWAQYGIQTTHGAINPTITVAGNTDTQFNSAAIAFKAAVAGAGADFTAGINVRHIYHVTKYAATMTMNFPCSGNLIVLAVSESTAQNSVTSPGDTAGDTFTKHVLDSQASPQIWSTDSGATCSSTSTVHFTNSSFQGSTFFYDISGAAASPFDSSATGTNSVSGVAATNGTCTTCTSISPGLAFVPSTSNGLVFSIMALGTGPASACTDSGCNFDSMFYTGETDAGGNDSADFYSHRYNPDTVSHSPVITVTNGSTTTGWDAMSVAYKKGP